MAGIGYTRMPRLLVFVWSCLFVAGAVGLAPRASRSTDPRQADARRSQLSRCVSCSVNGKLYDGHSRFQYEEGCSRYRCICRCDGSWECPAQYTEDICGNSAPSQDRHSSSSQGGDTRCRTCVVNGQEYQGRSYFTFVEGCLTIDNCVCNCNGSWVCPKERARSTCEGDASRDLAKIATWTVEIENSRSSSSGSSSSHSGSSSSGSISGSSGSGSSSSRSGISSSGSGNSGSSSSGSSFSSSNGSSFSSHESSFSGSSGSSSCTSCGESSISSSSSQDTSSQDRTSVRRTGDRRQTHRGCQDCTAMGKVFKGNSYFELEDGCRKMKNCICYCNGSWNCPDRFVENSCVANNDKTSREPSGCRSCIVKGNTFPGNQLFQFLDGCIEYRRCMCNCDGSWNCPGSSARNVCGQGGANTADTSSGTSCRQCEIKGQTFPANQYFDMADGCLEYKNCICRCDGSWSCPDSGARNKCQDTGGAVDTSSCRNCEVYGSTFPGNQYFQVKHGCIEYQNCICRCDGSWSCPGDSARNTCVGEGTSSNLPGGNDGGGQSVAQCLSCLAFGKNFTGGDYFDVVSGCTSYRNCVCRCDGSWDCNSRFATNICTNETRVNEERRGSQEERGEYRNASRTTSENQCSVCNTKSKVVRGNTYFEMTDGCLEYKNCLCRCDGSWECPSQYARNICTERPSTTSPTRAPVATCSNCHAKGKIVKGNTYFELIDGCIRYTSCRCNCDGRWDCPADRSQNICFTNTTMSDNRCSMCKSTDGRVHHPNSKFQLVEDCVEYNCECFCNGSWSCPGKSSRWVCQDRCLQCDVNGRKYQNNTQFVHKTGCLEYTCNCHCNGSWSCPGSTARNTCPVGVRDNCNKCIVSPSEVYEGESDFVLRQDCLHYKCRCNCDGSYSCPGSDARNVCRGEVLGGCKSCVVSETETHRGETDFTMRKDCIHYECRCNCDGGWECPAERARNICLGEAPGGCRVCRVSETENYRPNTVFDMRKGCINYKCKCNCDGGWSCPGEDARDVCKGEVPGGCRSCIVSENEFYPGNSNFEMVKSCIHYKCRCNCDGSYSCPGQTARRVCQAGSVAEAPTCRKCKVSDREQFDGNTTFSIDRGCIRYDCDCRCDGSWQCPPGKSRDTCASDETRVTRPTRCNTCKISNEIYPGNSSFKFTRGCSQFDCRCECSGRWSCDYRKATNICRGRNQVATERSLTSDGSAVRTRQDITNSGSSHNATRTTERGRAYVETDIRSHESSASQTRHGSRTSSSSDSSSSNADGRCRPCPTQGLRIEPNGQISLDHGCRQYRNCKCLCDGRWRCAEDTDRCGPTQAPVLADGQRSHRTETQSSSSTSQSREVDSSAWVFVDGADTSFKTRNEQTGGGYLVQVDTKYSPTYSANNENRQQLEQLESRPSSSSAFSSSGSSSMSSSFTASGSSPDVPASSSSSSFEGTGNNQCLRCQVDSKTYQAGAYFDMRRGCVVYKCLCLCSGSYRCRLTSDNECSMQDKQNTCSNCLYQGMVFPGNMGFTVREGCEEKQCSCNCDGTHACHTSKPIPGCTDASANAPSFPGYGNFYPIPGGLAPAGTGYMTNAGRTVFMTTCTTCQESIPGPVVYHTPVRPAFGDGGGGFGDPDQRFNIGHTNPRETCSGCVVDGQVRRGNSTFTFEKDCMEFDCFCACGGSWKCSGRLSLDCSPGFVPDTVPHTSGCRSCVVQGTTYPANARFSLRQGCHEYQCSCNCDGGWSCPAQHPVDLCPTAPARPNRGNVMDPQIVREDLYVADQGVSGTNLVQDHRQGNQQHISSEHHTTASDPCHECVVRGTTYPGKSRFFLRDGCIQRTCECHCNRTWSCAESVVDICRAAQPDTSTLNNAQCRVCRVGSDTFVSDKDFQINNGCHQHNCYCYCNGTFHCPPERARNICPEREETQAAENTGSGGDRSTGRVLSTLMAKENGDAVMAGKALGCKECNEGGQKIEALSTFVKQLGCYESLCQCQCNGKSLCPPSASVNVCELPDKKPMNERKGCQIGPRTHFTRVFAHVEDCIQRTCLCHDNGEWSCKRTANDIKVC